VLLPNHVLEGIVAGSVDRAFRRWKRPTVKAGGTLKTRIGVLRILSIEPVSRKSISEKDAMLAGNSSLADLLAHLDRATGDEIYRIRLAFAGPDPRDELRARVLTQASEIDAIVQKLDRMDASSSLGAWTSATFDLLVRFPGRRAPELAELLGYDTKPFKANVRKLKALGLTESLPVGYRISPRGRSLIDARPERFAVGSPQVSKAGSSNATPISSARARR
jgi:hypothetical protein